MARIPRVHHGKRIVLKKVDFSLSALPVHFPISYCVTRKAIILYAIILYFYVINLSKRKFIHIQRRSLRVIIVCLSFIYLTPSFFLKARSRYAALITFFMSTAKARDKIWQSLTFKFLQYSESTISLFVRFTSDLIGVFCKHFCFLSIKNPQQTK